MFWRILTIISFILTIAFLSTTVDSYAIEAIKYFSLSQTTIPILKLPLSALILKIILVTLILILAFALGLILELISSKYLRGYFKEALIHMRVIRAKHAQKSIDINVPYVYVLLCEIRAVLCNVFKTNKIALSLFEIEQRDNINYMLQSIYIDINGIIDTPIQPKTFLKGEGFCGKAWVSKSVVFGQRRLLWFFSYPGYKVFRNENSSGVNSICCIPALVEGNVVAIVSIDSENKKHFSVAAKREGEYKDVANIVGSLVGAYVIAVRKGAS